MADNKRRNALIGLFMLGGLVSLGILIVKFGESQAWFGKRYIVQAKFQRVLGLREGTLVHLAGVPVGNVRKMGLVDRQVPSKGVVAFIEVDSQYLVPDGSVAELVTQLMGQPIINIRPPLAPTEPLPTNGQALIPGVVTSPLDQVIDPEMKETLTRTTEQIGVLAKALTPAADAITNLLQQRTMQEVDTQQLPANLYTAVERLHSVLKHIETVLGDQTTQSNIKVTVDNLKLASEDARAAVASFREFGTRANETAVSAQKVVVKLDATVETTHEHIDTLGRKLVENSDRLATILDNVASASRDLAEGRGTIGMLLRDPKFYDELLLTTQRLGIAASELTVFVKQVQKEGLLGVVR